MRTDAEIAVLTTADQVAAKVEELYGDSLIATGVVHVTAVWPGRDRRRGAGYVTLEINPDTPRNAHHSFVLHLVRARADAIVTTGRILRRVPHLVHRLQGPGRVPAALAAWRRQHLGKDRPPVTLVLTSGRNLDFEHPIFRSGTRPLIYTTRRGQWRLESRAADCGVEVVGVAEPSVRGAIELLRYQFGAATLAIEAGPSVSRELYESPAEVDELLLSVYEEPEIPASVCGGTFLNAADLGRIFSRISPPARVAGETGDWSFQRFLR